MEKYRQVNSKENPIKSGWYNTDKGELYWFAGFEEWSSRNDRLSEEYPKFWYDLITDQNELLLLFAKYLHNHSYVNKGFKPETLVSKFLNS